MISSPRLSLSEGTYDLMFGRRKPSPQPSPRGRGRFLSDRFFNQTTDPLRSRVPRTIAHGVLPGAYSLDVMFAQRIIDELEKLISGSPDAQHLAHRFIFRQRGNHHRLTRREIFAHLDRRTVAGERHFRVPR